MEDRSKHDAGTKHLRAEDRFLRKPQKFAERIGDDVFPVLSLDIGHERAGEDCEPQEVAHHARGENMNHAREDGASDDVSQKFAPLRRGGDQDILLYEADKVRWVQDIFRKREADSDNDRELPDVIAPAPPPPPSSSLLP